MSEVSLMQDNGQPDAKERLLAAALDHFTSKGYGATSVRELCEAAGVTKPVLYYYFKNKEWLYLGLMDASYELFESTIARLCTQPGTAVERLIRFCEGILDVSIENKQVVRLIFSIYYGPSQGAPPYDFERYYERIMQMIAQLLQEGSDAGEIGGFDLNDATWVVMSHLNAAIEEQFCHHEPRIDKAMLVRMIMMLINSVRIK